MADWTTIPDSSIEPGKPIRSIDGLALRDNPIAIAEGAPGAPRIEPIAAMTHQGAFGAVGIYVVALNLSTSAIAAGATVAGSELAYPSDGNAAASPFSSSVTKNSSDGTFPSGYAALSGTWRNTGGYVDGRSYQGAGFPTTYTWYPSLWLRIA